MEMGAIDPIVLPIPTHFLILHLLHNDVVKQFEDVKKSSGTSKATTLLGYHSFKQPTFKKCNEAFGQPRSHLIETNF
jgi:hypothetical protein